MPVVVHTVADDFKEMREVGMQGKCCSDMFGEQKRKYKMKKEKQVQVE